MTDAGKKVKAARKLSGLTQRELAAHSGVSLSTIRKLEQGERSTARMETLHALARALRVETMSLVDAPREDGAPAETRDLWAPMRAELLRPPTQEQEGDTPATPAGVRRVLEQAAALSRGDQFAKLSAVLPALLRDADTLGEEGRRVRVQVLQLAASALTHTRQFDLAELAVRRSLADAQDRLAASASVNTAAWLLIRQGRLDEALSLATKWADDLEPPRLTRASPAELAAWGLLLLRAAGAAVRNNQIGAAVDMKRWAKTAATAIGQEVAVDHELIRTFGPTTVRLLAVEDAVVRDHPDTALTLARKVPLLGVRPCSSVQNRHGIDVAYAHAKLGGFAEAFGQLTKVQTRAPEWFPYQTAAQDALRAIVDGRRTLTPEMRHMAETLNLPL
ncbi:helix-turn-helix domain-containing protein [Streptomyces sp. NPDC059247]|uniref:helix-turn-helix domain-containing protein n=1 Tax=Streptomyces sp. NPDC059247 TaxID=3346790 RepID=UPI0036BDEBFE